MMERMDMTNSTFATSATPLAVSLPVVDPAARTTLTAVHAVPMTDRASSTYVRFVKPAVDRSLAALVLAVIALPLLVVAVAVAVSVGRPVIFRQQRVGRGERRFDVIKFRTMHHSRRQRQVEVPFPEDRRRTHKSESDPRLTGVGKFLRKWSIDELPQFINVLKGDMSIVGPRPELPSIVASYPDELHVRHAVKPGLTGLWQVSARGDGLMHEHGEWDIEYAHTVSFWTDLKILVKTPAALLGSRQGF